MDELAAQAREPLTKMARMLIVSSLCFISMRELLRVVLTGLKPRMVLLKLGADSQQHGLTAKEWWEWCMRYFLIFQHDLSYAVLLRWALHVFGWPVPFFLQGSSKHKWIHSFSVNNTTAGLYLWLCRNVYAISNLVRAIKGNPTATTHTHTHTCKCITQNTQSMKAWLQKNIIFHN